MTIHVLPDVLANKIAAGEVIERPASVVKELVENSIDAKSTSIKISLKEAGLEQIKITDNGIGMSEADCERAFLRHATSKIQDDRDLFHIHTLGFRGEALASIAAVSKLTIQTSKGNHAGTKIALTGGNIISRAKSDARQGTEITVDELFFNTPARLKYMRTLHTELGHVTDLLNRLAFAHPNIRFEVNHNGKQIFRTSGSGDLLQVISQVYGLNVAKKMLPIENKTLDFSIDGFISKPELTRASRSYITTIINGRYIRSPLINQAVLRAYHTLLPIRRFPIVILHIEMDPVLVDVNVHPTKLEVRFSKDKELMDAIEAALNEPLKQSSLIPTLKPAEQRRPSTQQTFEFHRSNKATHPLKQQPKQQTESPTPYEAQHVKEQEAKQQITEQPIVKNNDTLIREKYNERIPSLEPIGQLHGTYILTQNEEGLFMIDQHAAQERIKYEQYKQKLANPEQENQSLLMPLTFEFSKSESIFIEQFHEELQTIGLNFESFGDHTYIVRSHPTWFPEGEEEYIIRDLVEQVIQTEKINIADIRDEAAMLVACKRSIKANEYLNKEDMYHLIDQLKATKEPFTCPHGRPIIVHFSTYDLEKMFKRVM